jgi:hypothetical protein
MLFFLSDCGSRKDITTAPLPTDIQTNTLTYLPTAVILWSVVDIVVTRLVVPGSLIDVVDRQGTSVIQTAQCVWQLGVLLVLLLDVIYLTPYRVIYPGIPSCYDRRQFFCTGTICVSRVWQRQPV